MFDYKAELVRHLFNYGVPGIKPEGITLKSQRTSHWYVNCCNLSQSIASLEKTAHLFIGLNKEFFRSSRIDMFMGIPEGATLLGQKINEVLIFYGIIPDRIYQKRTKPKTHGDAANKFWVTGIKPRRIWLFEDVVTSGTSLIEFIKKIKEEDPKIEIIGLSTLLTSLQLDENGISVEDKLKRLHIPFFPVLTANDILPGIIDRLPVKEQDKYRKIINQEYIDEYGEKSPVSLWFVLDSKRWKSI